VIPRFNSITKHLPGIRGLSIPRRLYRKFLPKGVLFHINDFDGDLHLDVDISDMLGVELWHAPDLYEKEERALFCSVIKPGLTVLDVGANIGIFTLLAAKRGAKVFAIEPDPVNALRFRNHLSLNGLADKVEIFEIAATHEPSTLTLYRNPGNIGNSNLFAGDSPVSVKSMTIDSLNLPAIDVCKMDIEGAELSALLGMKETIRRSPRMKLLIEYFAERQASGELLSFLHDNFRQITVAGVGILSGEPPARCNLRVER